MRLELENNTLVLSERNLRALLTKLSMPGSACTIGGSEDCPMWVKAEADDVHYGKREYGPGPMHPITEAMIKALDTNA